MFQIPKILVSECFTLKNPNSPISPIAHIFYLLIFIFYFLIFTLNISPNAAMTRMADLCARSEQCEADIRQKLYRLGLKSGEVQEIVSKLISQSFIDNARYARAFANDKCRFSAWGRNKIRVGLIAKRICAADIAQALDALDPAEYNDALRRTAAAKARGMDFEGPDGRENRLKLFRHIISRGFESDLASKAISEIIASRRK